MRRLVNFRAPLFISIGLVLGIFSFYESLFGDFWFGLVILILLVALGITCLVRKCRLWLGIVAVLTAAVLGFAMSAANYAVLNKNQATNKDVLITGRVCDINRNGVEGGKVYLENCVDSDGVKYGGRIETYLFDTTVNTGDVVTIRGNLDSTYPIKGEVQAYHLRNRVNYKLDVELLVSQKGGKLRLDETIRKYIYETSSEYAPQNGDVLYALLTGDRSALSADKEVYFKSAGIIHLLAVSGLHVNFILAVLCFALKRFKLHPLIEGAIVLVPLAFYAYICNFTPSVVRAIVMLICAYLARAVFGRYDLLTSLSLAVIVILLVSPFNLFDTGFQLSALSVYGIATVYGTVNRLLAKRKIPKVLRYFVNSLAVSLSCSVATFFTLQLNYGYAPTLGLLLNIVVIPLVTFAFVLNWIGMLPWVFHYVLWAADKILQLVAVMARWVSGLSFATVSVAAIGVTAAIVCAWLFVLGGYVNLKKIGKIVVNSVLACAVALCVGLSYVRVRPRNQAFVTYGYGDVMSVTTSIDGDAVIVGNFSDIGACSQAINYIDKYSVKQCTLYVTDYGAANPILINDVLQQVNVDKVYALNSAYNDQVDEVLLNRNVSAYRHMENTSTGDSIVVTPIFDGGLRAVIVRVGTLTATAVYGEDYAVASYLELELSSDVYILPNANKAYSDCNAVTLSPYQSILPLNYGANKYGNFTITQKGDTISIEFR